MTPKHHTHTQRPDLNPILRWRNQGPLENCLIPRLSVGKHKMSLGHSCRSRKEVLQEWGGQITGIQAPACEGTRWTNSDHQNEITADAISLNKIGNSKSTQTDQMNKTKFSWKENMYTISKYLSAKTKQLTTKGKRRKFTVKKAASYRPAQGIKMTTISKEMNQNHVPPSITFVMFLSKINNPDLITKKQ